MQAIRLFHELAAKHGILAGPVRGLEVHGRMNREAFVVRAFSLLVSRRRLKARTTIPGGLLSKGTKISPEAIGSVYNTLTMKGPFPGMDPYLEARSSDVHVSLVAYIGESLQPHLPSDLRARADERLVENVEETHARRYIGPEFGPLRTDHQCDQRQPGDYAVIEILSPWNKGAGRLNKDYRKKLEDYARAEVSVVEIDLLPQLARAAGGGAGRLAARAAGAVF